MTAKRCPFSLLNSLTDSLLRFHLSSPFPGRLCEDAEAFDVEHLLEKARFLRVHIESVNLPRDLVDYLTRHREQTGYCHRR